MEQKKLIRFVESFIVLPLVSITLPLGGVPVTKTALTFGPQIALFQKTNTEVSDLLAFNQATVEDAKIRETRIAAINEYFEKRDMPLAGYGEKFMKASEANGLDWRLLPAISVIETTGGKALCKRLPPEEKWNPFGWGSCKIGFSSFEEAIEVVGRNLGGNNPRTARYYKDKTNKEILDAYNPPSIVPDYSQKVLRVMEVIGPLDLATDIKEKEA
ncbi:MAG: hypothetical protein ACKOW9_00610 [Candidatus Paceibacterota bacterium]